MCACIVWRPRICALPHVCSWKALCQRQKGEPNVSRYAYWTLVVGDAGKNGSGCKLELIMTSYQEALKQEQPRATIVLIILSSNKTQLTLFRNKSAYPLYMSIGNIPKEIWQKPSSRAYILLGYLPTSRLSHIKKSSHPLTSPFQLIPCMPWSHSGTIEEIRPGWHQYDSRWWIRVSQPSTICCFHWRLPRASPGWRHEDQQLFHLSSLMQQTSRLSFKLCR